MGLQANKPHIRMYSVQVFDALDSYTLNYVYIGQAQYSSPHRTNYRYLHEIRLESPHVYTYLYFII